MASVLVPLPDTDFDTTEVAVPWKLLRDAGHEVVFMTEKGGVKPSCDPLLLTGVIFGQLGAADEPKRFYEELQSDASYSAPKSWETLDVGAFDALLMPGGHAPGMRQYLGSEALFRQIIAFHKLSRPVAAICHGVLPLARAVDPATGKSVLHGTKTTCLPKYMERIAYFISFWKLGKYYRTYPEYVEDEVRRSCGEFVRGPIELLNRGTRENDKPAFVVEDDNYVSARWPGDAYLFSKKLIERLGR